MDQKWHNLVKRWAIFAKHLELQKFKLRRRLANESKRKEPNPSLNDHRDSPNHLTKRGNQTSSKKEVAQQKEEDYFLL